MEFAAELMHEILESIDAVCISGGFGALFVDFNVSDI